MAIKTALENITQRKIGVIGGTQYVTLPKNWGKKGETVFVAIQDENTLSISRNKKIYME
ncbi:MAG: hypothetical protein KAW93_06380 [Methanogenium sp.]|nr:hypothetical protein [Methanogenium sp.]